MIEVVAYFHTANHFDAFLLISASVKLKEKGLSINTNKRNKTIRMGKSIPYVNI